MKELNLGKHDAAPKEQLADLGLPAGRRSVGESRGFPAPRPREEPDPRLQTPIVEGSWRYEMRYRTDLLEMRRLLERRRDGRIDPE